MFLFRRPAIRCGAALQPLHQVLVEVAQRLDDIYSARPSGLDGDLAALQALAIEEDWCSLGARSGGPTFLHPPGRGRASDDLCWSCQPIRSTSAGSAPSSPWRSAATSNSRQPRQRRRAGQTAGIVEGLGCRRLADRRPRQAPIRRPGRSARLRDARPDRSRTSARPRPRQLIRAPIVLVATRLRLARESFKSSRLRPIKEDELRPLLTRCAFGRRCASSGDQPAPERVRGSPHRGHHRSRRVPSEVSDLDRQVPVRRLTALTVDPLNRRMLVVRDRWANARRQLTPV